MILVKTFDIEALTRASLMGLFVGLFAACQSIPSEYSSFLELPPAEQHREMRKLPIEKQIDYYIAGMRYVHPPQIGLAEVIAQEGKTALPLLMKRLKEEKDESNQAHIMYVFEKMHQCCYSLREESGLISQLKELTTTTKDPILKSRGEEVLTFILHNKLPDIKEVLEHSPNE